MINRDGNFLEVKPTRNVIGTNNGTESLICDLGERKIAAVHTHDTRKNVRKMKDWMQIFSATFGYTPQVLIVEILTVPTQSSTSKKTLSSELIYFDLQDAVADVATLREIIKEQANGSNG